MEPKIDRVECWPELPLAPWQETYATLHMWIQIVGKVRMTLTPPVNHWWHVPLYVNARGLTTGAIPYRGSAFEVQFDFVEHRLALQMADGRERWLALQPQTVAAFYRAFMKMLREEGVEVDIWRMPVEIPAPIPFDEDEQHGAYAAGAVERFWRILLSSQTVFQEFRSGFVGKCSPVHFFWGSFDLAVTRFSGRKAPERPGADRMTREAYSHEVSSVGFWPGAGLGEPAYYSYASPEPAGYAQAQVRPQGAHYDAQMKEFILRYEDVRGAESPSAALLEFCESTYAAGAELGGWDREALERRG